MTADCKGTVRNLDRNEAAGASLQASGQRDQVISFRIEHTDEHGDVTGYSQVELRGEVIYGGLTDGDRVEISGRKGGDGILRPSRAKNLSTDSEIWVSNRPGVKILQGIITVIMLLAFLTAAFFMITGISGGRFP
ncbi:hypothetical protein F4V91_32305 [Neorhizobium galegae]|uniref:Uncharacterized protein n=1 Tax=Neorhizobium galegae TaxID=399 RepID=A0A6A1TJ51_NEOGA|nr:hypothetical protein [Neorhizobium galegae]KAB1082626.1 hypothetical protein F4V91_32305 [Neorhizobium galegae]